MKVIKRGLFLLAILVFSFGSIRSALADCDADEFPRNGTYSFYMVGANTTSTTDVPTVSMSGTFPTEASGATFSVNASQAVGSDGTFELNDNGNSCTGTFHGSGSCQATGVVSGTMALTIDTLVGAGCSVLGTVGSPLTIYYSVAAQSGAAANTTNTSVMFLQVIDSNTISVVGEGQAQHS